MGKSGYTTRKAAFKQLDAAIGNYETALYHLLIVKNEYANEHPEIANAANEIMLLTVKVQDLAQAFRKSF